jgi:IS5 family transposase
MFADAATDDFFCARMDHMIDLRQPLAMLASRMPWQSIEASVAHLLSRKAHTELALPDLDVFGEAPTAVARQSNATRPRVPLRTMIALLFPKHAFTLSDEAVVGRWSETPRWQFFSGRADYEERLPRDTSTLVKFPRHLGEEGVEELLAQTVNLAVSSRQSPASALTSVVDTTVQEKAVAHPTNSTLLETARGKLVQAAQDAGIELRQTFTKEVKRLRRFINRQRTIVGRLQREMDRKANAIGLAARLALAQTLNKAQCIVAQSGQRKVIDEQPALCAWRQRRELPVRGERPSLQHGRCPLRLKPLPTGRQTARQRRLTRLGVQGGGQTCPEQPGGQSGPALERAPEVRSVMKAEVARHFFVVVRALMKEPQRHVRADLVQLGLKVGSHATQLSLQSGRTHAEMHRCFLQRRGRPDVVQQIVVQGRKQTDLPGLPSQGLHGNGQTGLAAPWPRRSECVRWNQDAIHQAIEPKLQPQMDFVLFGSARVGAVETVGPVQRLAAQPTAHGLRGGHRHVHQAGPQRGHAESIRPIQNGVLPHHLQMRHQQRRQLGLKTNHQLQSPFEVGCMHERLADSAKMPRQGQLTEQKAAIGRLQVLHGVADQLQGLLSCDVAWAVKDLTAGQFGLLEKHGVGNPPVTGKLHNQRGLVL